MPTLSENDPPPVGRGGPSPWVIAAIALVVVLVIVLHLTGVIGAG